MREDLFSINSTVRAPTCTSTLLLVLVIVLLLELVLPSCGSYRSHPASSCPHLHLTVCVTRTSTAQSAAGRGAQGGAGCVVTGECGVSKISKNRRDRRRGDIRGGVRRPRRGLVGGV